ncbi:MAG: hypothetical protein LAP21_24430 [Acidobacteriia bacterium]|nr:hypothetical protein [Terriglobia bacterium]
MKIRNLFITSALLAGLLVAGFAFAQQERRESKNQKPSKSLGEIHNDGVKYVLEHIKKVPPRDKLGPLIARLTNEFCVKSRVDCGTLKPDWQPSNTEQLLSTLGGSEAFKENIGSLFRLTQSEIAMTKHSLQQYQTSLDELEKTAERKLTGEERTRFLGAISVARSSAVFWAPKEAGGLDGRHFLNATNLPSTGSKKKVNWDAVVRADLSGLLQGGLGQAVGDSVHNLIDQLLT